MIDIKFGVVINDHIYYGENPTYTTYHTLYAVDAVDKRILTKQTRLGWIW